MRYVLLALLLLTACGTVPAAVAPTVAPTVAPPSATPMPTSTLVPSPILTATPRRTLIPLITSTRVLASPARPTATLTLAQRIPTSTAGPSPTPAPRTDADYVALAKAGMTLPIVGRDTPGEWKGAIFEPSYVQIVMPLSVGLSNEQTVRLGKVLIAMAVKALFDGAPELTRVGVIGTTPYNGSEAPAISIVVERAAYDAWDQSADNLGPWQVSQRLR